MNYAAVYHRAGEQYCYPKNEEELIINIKTGYEVEQVWIVSGDPYEAGIAGSAQRWQGIREEIFFKKDLEYQRWWTTTVRPPYKRLKYYFILQSGTETWYYFENGFLSEEQAEGEGRMLQYFTCPWMNSSDIGRTPDWVPRTVWYQIFPDRFCRGNHTRKIEGRMEWETRPVTNEELFGGDLEGIIEKLNYLQELGITGIYLTPIFDSPSAHKYDTRDYYQIDWNFGDERALHELVQEAHRRGIRVMIDMVFNHCGALFSKWQDVVQYGPDSGFYNWFMVNQWPFEQHNKSTRDKRFYSFAFTSNMPKFNTNNHEVVEYLTNICIYWVTRFQVDGLRFDVGNEISHTFVRHLREKLKAVKPEIYLLGEIWQDAGEWLAGDQYDGVMNYPLTESINDFWVDPKLTNRDFACMINRSYTMYREASNQALFNLLDSHDTDRLFSRVGEDENIFYQQLAVLFTMPGSPCILYGTEVALPGGHDPDCRRCMPWEQIRKGEFKERIRSLQKLIRLRRENRCFISPYFHFPEYGCNPRILIYEKLTGFGEKNTVVLNCSDNPISVQCKTELFARGYCDRQLKPGGILVTEGELEKISPAKS